MINIQWTSTKWDDDIEKWLCCSCKQEVDIGDEELLYQRYAEESVKQRQYEEGNYEEV